MRPRHELIPDTIADELIVRIEVSEGSYTNAASENSYCIDVDVVAGVASSEPPYNTSEPENFKLGQKTKGGAVSATLKGPDTDFYITDNQQLLGIYVHNIISSEDDIQEAVHELLDKDTYKRVVTFSGQATVEAAVTALHNARESGLRPEISHRVLNGITLAVNYLNEPIRGSLD